MHTFLDLQTPDSELIRSFSAVFYPVLPFDYVNLTFQPQAKWKETLSLVLSLVISAKVLRLLWLSYGLFHGRESEVDTAFVLLLLASLYVLALLFHWNGYTRGTQLVRALYTWQKLKEGEVTEFSKIIRFFLCMAVLNTGLTGFFFVRNPNSPVFLFSTLGLVFGESNWILYASLFPTFFVYELGFWWFAIFGTLVTYDSLMVAMSNSVSARMKELNNISAHPELRSLFLEFDSFRELSLYQQFIQDGTGTLFFQSKVLAYFQLILIMVMTVRGIMRSDLHQVSVALFLICPIGFRMRDFLWAMMNLSLESRKVLRKWDDLRWSISGPRTRAELRLMLQSFQPIRVSVGGLYEVKGLTILSFYGACVQNAIVILITWHISTDADA